MDNLAMEYPEQFQIGRIRKIQGNFITLSTGRFYKRSMTLNTRQPDRFAVEDIVVCYLDGEIQSLWRPQCKDNIILTTTACNLNCQFCPQPRVGDENLITLTNDSLINNLRHKDINSVTITGGEPTLLGLALPKMIQSLLSKNRKAFIAILTNGMEFDDVTYANEVVKAGKSQTRICIPIHSDVPSIHDSITGVGGSFDRTALGLLNLQRAGADIEIRVVLSNLNAGRLPNIAHSISMNFPFVVHVAFMGMEINGNASTNVDAVWINPPEYMNNLSRALYRLKCSNIPASIYNLPYCLVPSSLWTYLRDSISGWKKVYLPVCDSCCMRATCPGLFGTSLFQSPSITPIKPYTRIYRTIDQRN
jgi:His-Xaa-Ser system radical SAM maturase HxsC